MAEELKEKAVFVGIIKQGDDERKIMEYLEELEFLADTAGLIGYSNCRMERRKAKFVVDSLKKRRYTLILVQ